MLTLSLLFIIILIDYYYWLCINNQSHKSISRIWEGKKIDHFNSDGISDWLLNRLTFDSGESSKWCGRWKGELTDFNPKLTRDRIRKKKRND